MASQDTSGSGGNTTYFAAGGAVAVGLAAAAGVFYFRKGYTVTAQVATRTFTDNQNLNPVYESMEQFDNPFYDPNDLDPALADGFSDTTQKSPAA